MAEPVADAKSALTTEIADLKKSRRTIEKDARKTIRGILASSDDAAKKLADRRAAKKAMKAALVTSKTALKEKKKAMKAL